MQTVIMKRLVFISFELKSILSLEFLTGQIDINNVKERENVNVIDTVCE